MTIIKGNEGEWGQACKHAFINSLRFFALPFGTPHSQIPLTIGTIPTNLSLIQLVSLLNDIPILYMREIVCVAVLP